MRRKGEKKSVTRMTTTMDKRNIEVVVEAYVNRDVS